MRQQDLKKLSDDELLNEIQFCERQLAVSEHDFRNQRNNISDAGWLALQNAVIEWESNLQKCLAEKERRKLAKKASAAQRQPVPNRNAQRKPSLYATEGEGHLENEEAEAVPIIIIENGIPRRWRPGDKIHK
ncbi:MAG: hypothetical protein GC201_02230 [Alphaproteobacteria bacterium]|nr:hypothetical protein [Alphaproteobacteria bacterium]